MAYSQWSCQNSVVNCFFIETEKVLSALQSTPAIEDFFWQESAIVIAKLVLPQQFEEMSMQELRALVLERSTMRTYLKGEMIEIFPYDVAIILEGFVKQEDNEVFITAPAALGPSNIDHHLTSQDSRQPSRSHQGHWFQADTHSRIIIFDFSLIHNEFHLHRASASFLSHSLRIPGRLSHEHDGLVSWPEKQYSSEQPSGKIGIKPCPNKGMSKGLSAKAMELSIYGSMVNRTRHSSRGSFVRIPRWAGSHSRSYPSVSSQIKKFWSSSTLPSARSERGAAMRRRLRSQDYISTKPIHVPSGPRATEDSSEGSDGDDEHIVRIDSPSSLFHHHFSH